MSSFPRRRRSYDEQSLPGISTDHATTINNYNPNHTSHHCNIMRGGEGIPAKDVHRRPLLRRATMTATTKLLLPHNYNNMSTTTTRGRGGIFASSSLPLHHRPLTVRTILSIASMVLILLVVGDICFVVNDKINDRATDDIKELTQTVMRLSQELHEAQLENERNRHKLGSKIESTRENRHVANNEESQRGLKESMLDQKVQKGQRNNIIDTKKEPSKMAAREQQEHEVLPPSKEYDEHIQLKEALAKSIDELDRVRQKQKQQQQQPIVLGEDRSGGNGERGGRLPSGENTANTKPYDGLLRGGSSSSSSYYQPGDGIEIINNYGIAKKQIALRPGIVTDANSDGTYTLVQLESSHPIKNIHREGFRLYQVYTGGTPAFYEQHPRSYVPITIVRYIQSSARPGLEVHGNYEFTYDADENQVIHEGRAMLIYRYANDDETIA